MNWLWAWASWLTLDVFCSQQKRSFSIRNQFYRHVFSIEGHTSVVLLSFGRRTLKSKSRSQTFCGQVALEREVFTSDFRFCPWASASCRDENERIEYNSVESKTGRSHLRRSERFPFVAKFRSNRFSKRSKRFCKNLVFYAVNLV